MMDRTIVHFYCVSNVRKICQLKHDPEDEGVVLGAMSHRERRTTSEGIAELAPFGYLLFSI